MTGLHRVPAEHVGAAVELVEMRAHRRHGVFGDGLGRPAFGALHGAQRAVLAEEDDLVVAHAENLAQQVKAKLLALEKKMLRAERRKQSVDIQRIHRIKKELFPQNNLQEREEHFSKWVGQYGLSWIDSIMENSTSLESRFSIIKFD